MSRQKKIIWIFILTFFFLLDIITHFTSYSNMTSFAGHLNYFASVFMAFTIGVWYTDIAYDKEEQCKDKQIKDSKN